MAEDKKKKNTTNNKKVNNAKKTTTTKKGNTQNNKKKQVKKTTTPTSKQQPKKQVKKVAPKKTETKKVAPKKVKEPKVEKVELEVTEEIEQPIVTEEIKKTIEIETEEDKESILEKTLIFDGRENQNLAEVVKKLEEENVVLDDKVIKRSKGKKIAVLVLTALIFVVILATIIYVIRSEVERVTNNQTLNSNIYDKVSNKYDSIDDIDTEKKTESSLDKENYEYIESISLGEFEKKILKNEDMVVMITSSTCFFCAEYEPIVDEVFQELGKKVYRLNITSLHDVEVDRLRTYYAFKKTPTMFIIKNGIVKQDLVGKQPKAELKNWLDKYL